MSAEKPVTVQKVSAVLRKAGFAPSGGSSYVPTSGFRVSKWWKVEGAVRVRHVNDNHRSLPADQLAERLTAYRDALEAAGIATEPGEGDAIICTHIKEA